MLRRVMMISLLVPVFLVVSGARGQAVSGSAVDRSDPIAVLQSRIDQGGPALNFEAGHGLLRSLLERLGVPTRSQILVFSKTSLQDKLIGPATPRAIYFNDRVTVGSVQNSPVLEIMAPASRGYVFYTLENKPGGRFVKHEGADCGRCHGSDSLTPGLIIASTPVRQDGTPVFIPSDRPPRLFEFTDHATPIAERWGGWYVTGSHAGQPHLGNGAFVYDDAGVRTAHNKNAFSAVTLDTYFDVARYLEPTSDIVALMVFEHQAKMTNMLLAAGVIAARMQHLAPSTREEIVAYMLFADEAPLAGAINGSDSFQAVFTGQGPRDSAKRTLREFDLKKRLFKYPLSYMIYSPVFDVLPSYAKRDIYTRLLEILEARDDSARYSYLSADDRRGILEILRATKPDFTAASN